MNRPVSRIALMCAVAALLMVMVSLFKVMELPDILIYSVSAPEVSAGGAQGSLPGSPPDDSSDDPADNQADGGGTKAGDPATGSSALKDSVRLLREAMETLSEYIQTYTLTGYAHEVSVGDGEKLTQKADLFALSEQAASINPMHISYGRMMYDEELRYGDRVAMLSAQLAVDLFRVSDATGKEITINGESYTVVGVTRRGRQVGDTSKYQVYLPLRALAAHGKTPLTQLTLLSQPLPGSGAAIGVEKAARAWRPGGSFYQMEREKVRAVLIPRVLMGLLWLYVLILLFKWLFALAARFVNWVRQMMRMHYLSVLVLRIVPGVLAGLAILFALLALCYAWAGFMMQPVLLFPEWVPAVPVEFGDIETTFWFLQSQASAQVQYFTPEMARMGFFGSLGMLGSVLMLVALCVQLGHSLRRRRGME